MKYIFAIVLSFVRDETVPFYVLESPEEITPQLGVCSQPETRFKLVSLPFKTIPVFRL